MVNTGSEVVALADAVGWLVQLQVASPTPTPGGARGFEQFTPGNLLYAGLFLLSAYFLAKSVSYVLSAAADRVAENRFRVAMFIPLTKFLIYGGSLYVVARTLFELGTAQLVALSGLLGAAIGFGLKDLLADVVGGLVLVVEKPFQVGDKVAVGDQYGEVVDIGIRSTRLLTPNDTLVVVPNFNFFNEMVANANTSDAEMMVVVEFHLAPGADASRAADIVEDALVTSPYVYVSEDHPFTVLVEDDLYYRTITGKAYVNDLRNEHAFKSDVSERVLAAFRAEGIDSPRVPGADVGFQ